MISRRIAKKKKKKEKGRDPRYVDGHPVAMSACNLDLALTDRATNVTPPKGGCVSGVA